MNAQRAPVQLAESEAPIAVQLRAVVLRKICGRVAEVLKRHTGAGGRAGAFALSDATLLLNLNGARGEQMFLTREILRQAVTSKHGRELFRLEELLGGAFAVRLVEAEPAPKAAAKPKEMPAGARVLNFGITLAGGKRGKVTAAIVDGDQIEFSVDGVSWGVKIPLQPLFWQAVRDQGKRHGLLPRSLKGAKPKKVKRPTDTHYAKMYGVSRGRITAWRKQGAPLNNPDKMGDLIFKAGKKVRGG